MTKMFKLSALILLFLALFHRDVHAEDILEEAPNMASQHISALPATTWSAAKNYPAARDILYFALWRNVFNFDELAARAEQEVRETPALTPKLEKLRERARAVTNYCFQHKADCDAFARFGKRQKEVAGLAMAGVNGKVEAWNRLVAIATNLPAVPDSFISAMNAADEVEDAVRAAPTAETNAIVLILHSWSAAEAGINIASENVDSIVLGGRQRAAASSPSLNSSSVVALSRMPKFRDWERRVELALRGGNKSDDSPIMRTELNKLTPMISSLSSGAFAFVSVLQSQQAAIESLLVRSNAADADASRELSAYVRQKETFRLTRQDEATLTRIWTSWQRLEDVLVLPAARRTENGQYYYEVLHAETLERALELSKVSPQTRADRRIRDAINGAPEPYYKQLERCSSVGDPGCRELNRSQGR